MNWDLALCTGVEEIDRQHRRLVDCVNQLQRSSTTGGVIRLADAMDELLWYVTVHFATEENLMRQCAYPHLVAHIAEHRAFARDLKALMHENLVRDNSAKLVAFFDAWLENHLKGADMAYVPYLGALATQDLATG
jgi:hemerythrin